MKEFLKMLNNKTTDKPINKINTSKSYWKSKIQKFKGESAIFLTGNCKEEGSLVTIKDIFDNHVILEKAEYTKNGMFRCNTNISVNYESFICNQAKLVIIND